MISVLLPVFNEEKYIKNSVQSILNSTFEDYELVIVNDGSNDNTKNIIENFNDPRIKKYDKINSGLIDSLNYGLKKCNYDIIMRMDADDLIHPKKIENQIKFFKETNSILTGTQGYIINSNDEIIGNTNLPLDSFKIIQALKNFRPSFIHPSIMFYKEALIKSGGYNELFKHSEDYELFWRLCRLGIISNLDEKLIYLRKHRNNVSHRFSEEQIENTLVAKSIHSIGKIDKISKKDFIKVKIAVRKNFIKKYYVKIHKKIIELEFLNIKINFALKFSLKVIRRILKKFI